MTQAKAKPQTVGEANGLGPRPWKSYPMYRDSGVEWLGEVPEHWDHRRLWAIGKFTASGIDKKIEEGESLVSMVNYLDVYNHYCPVKFYLTTRSAL